MSTLNAIEVLKKFWHDQSRNYKVFLVRNVLTALSRGGGGGGGGEGGGGAGGGGEAGGGQYWNIFIERLGATTIEIGFISSVNHAVMALLAMPSGWLTDRTKKMRNLFLVGRGLSVPTSLARYLARTWPICMVIDAWQAICMRISGPASQIIWIDALSNRNRVTGLSFNRMIMSIAGIVAPMISAFIIAYFGGLDTAEGIRPLFLFQFGIGIVIFIFSVIKMREVVFTRGRRESSVLSDFFSVLQEVPGLKLLLLRQCVQNLVAHLIMPFRGLYLVDVKGADEFILGWRGTVSTALMVCFSIPAGRLADRFGRKKIAYFSRVFAWLSILITIFTPSTHPEYLIVASFMQGFQIALFIGWTAFTQELIPLEKRGRWAGITMLVHGVIGVIAPVMGGMIWNLNPDYIWWINLIGDACVMLPVMMMIPDIQRKN